ncbi:hypothetical protein HHK36_000802 [Tetracentron sinense]|uniref:Protein TRIGALACTOSYLDIACYLGLYCEROL 4, chloroplastic n=1 Tax=Tetracentron sinense TaxID=13715 RepID=A0A835DR17_TETSI|nr:hypothetical protein HHK36_000802 [Tetracentron sinense]
MRYKTYFLQEVINSLPLGTFEADGLEKLKHMWLGLIGQFRPKKLISSIKAEVAGGDELELPSFKDVAKHFLDKSLYSFNLCSQVSLSPASSLLVSTEGHGERKGRRSKAMLFHKASLIDIFLIFLHYLLPDHDITLEAAWPELFIDRNGGYWDVPESISLDLSSLTSESGLRYRFGVHKSSGHPQAVNTTSGDPPSALMPGLCAKAAFSYEKSRDIWREKEKQKNIIKADKDQSSRPSYDIRLEEPHAAISGIIGGACTAWFRGRESSVAVNSSVQSGDGVTISMSTNKRNPLGADLFGSVCYTFQHGKFKNLYNDLTRVDARLDICSASAFAKNAAHLVSNIFRSSSVKSEVNPLASPRLNVIFQQQVAGPIVFRIDSKCSFDSSSERRGLHIEDMIYSLSYSLRLLQSGKVVAWYSPKRKEGMIELRLFEF